MEQILVVDRPKVFNFAQLSERILGLHFAIRYCAFGETPQVRPSVKTVQASPRKPWPPRLLSGRVKDRPALAAFPTVSQSLF